MTDAAGKSFVLVHGAWHGGWCWRRVADRLRAQGHHVFTPTLTGLGERAHLLSDDIDLSRHIEDVVAVLTHERLEDVVLCGHSYGGLVISGVAERALPEIASIVYLDAVVPGNGDSMAALVPAPVRAVIEAALARGERTVPPRSAAAFNVNEADRAWIDSLCGPQPIGCMTETIALTGAYERVPRKSYIRATGYPNPSFDAALAKVRANPAWTTYEIDCGHDVMVDAPARLTEILLAA
ncbi:MAG TPA: alpha/beta hydrolase [Pseudolabrys sp.]|nr:alpha/beta hydrolase [Pseudolabrys sp.]